MPSAPMSAAQLGLFDDWTLRLQRVRRVLLESLDLESALEELSTLAARGPDSEIAALLETVTGLQRDLDLELGKDGDPVAALLRLEPAVPPWLVPGWCRYLTLEAERRDGTGCRIGDESAGWYFLRAGDLDEAERSLRATLARDPKVGRSRARLGDVLARKGATTAARTEYLAACLTGPRTMDWAQITDTEVAALPSIVASEHQVAESPEDWAAALGTIEGLWPFAHPELPGLAAAEGEPAEAGLRFYALLCQERAAGRDLARRARIRRQMKALCPSLLAAYLEKWL